MNGFCWFSIFNLRSYIEILVRLIVDGENYREDSDLA